MDGQEITGCTSTASPVRAGCCGLFQKTVVFKALDVEENLIIAGQMFTFPSLFSTFSLGRMSRQRVAALRERLGELTRWLGCGTSAICRRATFPCVQKLIQFASMLMPEPKIILLDEPMAGINPKIIERVVETIKYAKQILGVSFLVIEHNIDVVTSICERVVVLDQGRKLAEGTPQSVVQNQQQGGLSRWLIQTFPSRTYALATAHSIS